MLWTDGYRATWTRKAIHDYLTYQFRSRPGSGFKAVRKLPPAHVLVFENGAK